MKGSRIRIALDAMGTDNAPAEDVRGAVEALRERRDRDFEIVLVGRESEIAAELAKHPGADRDRISIVDAPDVIAMGAEPAQAVRAQRESSLVRGVTLHAERQVDAFVSAGNTGAVMTASTLILGRLAGISRPTVGLT